MAKGHSQVASKGQDHEWTRYGELVSALMCCKETTRDSPVRHEELHAAVEDNVGRSFVPYTWHMRRVCRVLRRMGTLVQLLPVPMNHEKQLPSSTHLWPGCRERICLTIFPTSLSFDPLFVFLHSCCKPASRALRLLIHLFMPRSSVRDSKRGFFRADGALPLNLLETHIELARLQAFNLARDGFRR